MKRILICIMLTLSAAVCSAQTSTQINPGRINWALNPNTAVTAKDVIPNNTPYIDVRSYGATGNGTTDDSAAIQAAVTASTALGQCVFFPATPNGYVINTPVGLTGAQCLEGVNGSAFLGVGTIIKPLTAAFVTASPLTQEQDVTIRDFHFIGGTNPIDLGEFQSVHLYDIMFQDFTGWGFSHVRGERHELRNITCWHHTVSAQGCISLADETHSIFAAQYAAAGFNDQWWDRSLIDHVFDLGDNSTTLTDQYVIWSDAGSPGHSSNGELSNTNLRWILGMNAGQTSVVRSYSVGLTEFHNIATDGIGTSTTPVGRVFDVEGFFKYSSLDGFYPTYSSNSYWTTAAYFAGGFFGSTIKNCSLGGNNTSTFGLYFQANYGSYGEIIGCDGAYYNNTTSQLWRNEISITGSTLNPVNASGGVNLIDITNQGAAITLMNDNAGANAATSAFRIIHATGLGNQQQTFSVQPTGASFDSGVATFGTTGVLKYSTDTGLSRLSAGTLVIGNGTAGDYSGSLQAGAFKSVGTTGYNSYFYGTSVSLSDLSGLFWSSAADGNGTKDTSIARCGAGAICVGNGTGGNTSGTVKASSFYTTGAGYTGTKTAGSCVFTISGGIITNVTGC
jgi:hypothetical protein